MWVVALEALVALCLLLLIVWLTMGSTQRRDAEKRDAEKRDAEKRDAEKRDAEKRASDPESKG